MTSISGYGVYRGQPFGDIALHYMALGFGMSGMVYIGYLIDVVHS